MNEKEIQDLIHRLSLTTNELELATSYVRSAGDEVLGKHHSELIRANREVISRLKEGKINK